METTKYLLPILAQMIRYFLFAGMAFFTFYVAYKAMFQANKIQKRKALNKDFYREILSSMQTTLVIGLVSIALLFSPLREYTAIYEDIHQQPLFWIPISVLLALVIHDTYFYWMHRLAHHPKIFKYVHLTHHKSTNPSPWTSYSFGLLEALFEALVAPIILMLVPMHPSALMVFALTAFSINVYGHLGYEIMPKEFRKSFLFEIINTSVHHDLHHHKFKGNYGLYFRIWDRIMNTENKKYVQAYDEIQSARFKEKTT